MDSKISEIFIPGPAGRLEAKYFKSKKNTSPIALILHPHPQYGGTMNNNVVVNTFNIFMEKNFSVCRLNFIGVGNTFKVDGTTVDVSIQGGGGGSGAGFSTSNAGLHTTSSIGVNTSALASTLTGVGNSFQGIYVSNGMMIMDNTLNGDHYIGTTYNGLMAGPVNIEGTLSIDGNYVVV